MTEAGDTTIVVDAGISAPSPSPAPAVRGAFQCTFEDFREANRGHTAGSLGRKKAPPAWLGLVPWAIFIAAGAYLAIVARPAPPVNGPPDPRDILPGGTALVARYSIALAPTVIVFALFLAQMIRGTLRPRLAWAPRQPNAMAVVIAVVTAAVLFCCFNDWPRSLLSNPDPRIWPRQYEFMLPLGVWVTAIVLLVVVFNGVNRGPALRTRWELQQFLHRPYTLAAMPQGMTLAEPRSSHWYGWDYFPGFRETPNLLLLYVSPYGFWIIPKRAFAEPDQLSEFKALVLTGVKQGTFLPNSAAGFPITLSRTA